MCYIRPLRVQKIIGKKATLENGMSAYYDRKIGLLKKNDTVLVYGNLILNKVYEKPN